MKKNQDSYNKQFRTFKICNKTSFLHFSTESKSITNILSKNKVKFIDRF